jgi:hypothetical protein
LYADNSRVGGQPIKLMREAILIVQDVSDHRSCDSRWFTHFTAPFIVVGTVQSIDYRCMCVNYAIETLHAGLGLSPGSIRHDKPPHSPGPEGSALRRVSCLVELVRQCSTPEDGTPLRS